MSNTSSNSGEISFAGGTATVVSATTAGSVSTLEFSTPRQLTLIPTEDINRFGARLALDTLPPDSELTGEPDAVLLQTVKDYGVIVPIVVVQRSDASIDVAEGRRRVKAARAAGLDLIPAEVWETDQPISHVLTLITNEVRRPNEASEFDAYRELQRRGLDDERVCQVTGIHPTKLHRLAGLAKLSDPLLEGLRRGQVSFSVAVQAAGTAKAVQEALATRLGAEQRLTGADVARAKQEARSAPGAPAQQPLILGEGAAHAPDAEIAAATATADDPAGPATPAEADEAAVFYQYLGAWVFKSLAASYPGLENVEQQEDDSLLLQLEGGELRTVKITIDEVAM